MNEKQLELYWEDRFKVKITVTQKELFFVHYPSTVACEHCCAGQIKRGEIV